MNQLFMLDERADSKSVEFLLAAIESANMPGFDYVEYKKALVNLAQMGIDQETAFKTAFATAATMGLTKEKLVSSAQFYKQVIEGERPKFDAALQRQEATRIGDNKAAVDQHQQLIAANEAKIKQLQAEIEAARVAIARLDQDRQDAQQKIEARKNGFIYAYEVILAQMQQDIDNIGKFIP